MTDSSWAPSHPLGLRPHDKLFLRPCALHGIAGGVWKLPGQRATLDALCIRFGIDLDSRKRGHGAQIDCCLSARVYSALCDLGVHRPSVGNCTQSAMYEGGEISSSDAQEPHHGGSPGTSGYVEEAARAYLDSKERRREDFEETMTGSVLGSAALPSAFDRTINSSCDRVSFMQLQAGCRLSKCSLRFGRPTSGGSACRKFRSKGSSDHDSGKSRSDSRRYVEIEYIHPVSSRFPPYARCMMSFYVRP